VFIVQRLLYKTTLNFSFRRPCRGPFHQQGEKRSSSRGAYQVRKLFSALLLRTARRNTIDVAGALRQAIRAWRRCTGPPCTRQLPSSPSHQSSTMPCRWVRRCTGPPCTRQLNHQPRTRATPCHELLNVAL